MEIKLRTAVDALVSRRECCSKTSPWAWSEVRGVDCPSMLAGSSWPNPTVTTGVNLTQKHSKEEAEEGLKPTRACLIKLEHRNECTWGAKGKGGSSAAPLSPEHEETEEERRGQC